MEFPEELLYTEEHEWAAIDDDVATVGVTRFSLHQRGAIEEVDLPAEGAMVEAGRAFAVLHGENTVADVYAPVSGEIIEVNEELQEDPSLVGTSPYDDGWLVKIRLSRPAEVKDLLDADDYAEMVEDIGLPEED